MNYTVTGRHLELLQAFRVLDLCAEDYSTGYPLHERRCTGKNYRTSNVKPRHILLCFRRTLDVLTARGIVASYWWEEDREDMLNLTKWWFSCHW